IRRGHRTGFIAGRLSSARASVRAWLPSSPRALSPRWMRVSLDRVHPFNPRAIVRRLLLATAACAVVSAASKAQSTQRLEQESARIEPSSAGTLGVAAMHLESGRTFFHKADEQYPMASTYKVPMAVQAFTLAQE